MRRQSFLRRSLLAASALALPIGAAAQEDAAEIAPPPFTIRAETPIEHVDAAVTMLRIGRADVAKQQLQAALELQPSENVLREMQDRYGTGQLLRFGRDERLAPFGQQLLERVVAAVDQCDASPDATDVLLTRLGGTGEELRRGQIAARRGGREVAIRLIDRISGATDAELVAIARGLEAVGGEAAEALFAMRLDTDPAVASLVAAGLRQADSRDMAVELIATENDPVVPKVTRDAVAAALDRMNIPLARVAPVRTLRETAIQLLQQSPDVRVPDVAYDWNAETQTLAARDLSVKASRRVRAANLLAAASRIDPSDASVRSLSASLDDETTVDAVDALQTLALAIDLNLPELGTQATHRLEASPANFAAGSPLIDALNAPSRRVQFEAALAAARLADGPFRNSHRVVEILGANLNSDGSARVVVADPNGTRGNETGGLFNGFGYSAVTTRSSREAIELAATQSNTALIVLHPSLVRHTLSRTLASLAADARTREIPVAVLASFDVLPGLRPVLVNHPQAILVENSIDPDYVLAQVRSVVPDADMRAELRERSRRSRSAIAELAAEKSDTFDLSLIAGEILAHSQTASPGEAVESATALLSLGDPAARRAIEMLRNRAHARDRTKIEAILADYDTRYSF